MPSLSLSILLLLSFALLKPSHHLCERETNTNKKEEEEEEKKENEKDEEEQEALVTFIL